MKRIAYVCVLLLGLPVLAKAQTDKTEVASGVFVSRKTYDVPSNEAPLFNFVEKTEPLKQADKTLVEGVLQRIPNRSQAARHAATAGWNEFVAKQDLATAAKRFNQAYLLDPRESIVYHGFAIIVAERFKDFDYADELFRVAARMNSPAVALSADHGRVLMMAGRPRDAKPLLEKAVRDDPGWAVPRSNLAWAAFLVGEPAEACRLALDVKGREIESVARDLDALRQKAKC
jgi:Flp pilus assembly protein TadD